MKSRKACSETRRKFRVKFPGRPVPNPSTIRRQAKRFKETGSVKNRKVNHRRHVLTEETLDETGERNWTEITVSVWEQRQYADPLVGKPASQGREREPSVAARSIWEALHYGQVNFSQYCRMTSLKLKNFHCYVNSFIFCLYGILNRCDWV